MTVANPVVLSELPDVPLGTPVYVLTGTATSGVPTPDTLMNGDYVRAGVSVSQSAYPELFAQTGVITNTHQNPTGISTASFTGIVTGSLNPDTFRAGIYDNGVYIVTGGAKIWTSTNGITWTARTSNTTSIIYSIAYGNGIFVYGAGATGNTIGRSTDNGVTWTTAAISGAGIVREIIFDGTQFVLAHESSVTLRTSTDGVTWLTRTSPVAVVSLTYGNGTYVVGGGSGQIRTSTDLIAWNTVSSGTINTISNLEYGNNLFLYSSSGTIATSTDAVTWTLRNSGTTIFIPGPNMLKYRFGWYIYVTTSDFLNSVWTVDLGRSVNGINWVRDRRFNFNINGSFNFLIIGPNRIIFGGGSSSGSPAIFSTVNDVDPSTNFVPLPITSTEPLSVTNIVDTSQVALNAYVRARP